MLTRKVPSTGELIPAIGMGTWRTFMLRDMDDAEQLRPLEAVLKMFFDAGGRVVDTSPMYGSAEDVTGLLAEKLGINDELFIATKVWTNGVEAGVKQMEASLSKLRRKSIELMQVHNLVDWQNQLATLREWKARKRFKYIGVTHYAPGQFDEVEKIVRNEKIDFVQLPYAVSLRAAENRLIPAARDAGVAILVMQPFASGNLFGKVAKQPLPDSIKPFASSWAQAFLKWILANESITAVLPATGNPNHMKDNLEAGFGRLPDEAERRMLIKLIDAE